MIRDVRPSASAIGSSAEPYAMLDRVGEVIRLLSGVMEADLDVLGVEDLLDLVPDQLVHRLHVEVLGEGRPGRC